MGSHSRHHRHRSPSYDSYTSSDNDSDHASRHHGRHHRSSKSHRDNTPKSSHYPRRSHHHHHQGGEADAYYHSDDSLHHNRSSRGRKHDRAPTYVTDPEDSDYEYEIPRSRIGSVEPLPKDHHRKKIVDDILAAFGLAREKAMNKDTVYVNEDEQRDRARRAKEKENRRRHRSSYDKDRDAYERDAHKNRSGGSSSADEEAKHQKHKHWAEAAAAGKVAYDVNKMRRAERREKKKLERGEVDGSSSDDEDKHQKHKHWAEAAAAGKMAYGLNKMRKEGKEDKRQRRRPKDDQDENDKRSRRASRSDRRSRGSSSSSRSRSRDSHKIMDEEHNPDANKALRAAIMAAAMEAYRSRKADSGITANRLMRIAASAIAAGGVDTIMHANPESEQLRNIIDAAIGGLKASAFFGHRIRRRHGIGQRELVKTNLMRVMAGKAMDRGALGHHTKNPKPRKERHHSSNRVSSAWRALNDEWGGA